MTADTLSNTPAASVAMLIRRPVDQVFNAFIDPDVTTKFWFTHSSGRLAAGTQVRWEWAMYGHAVEVSVKTIDVNRRIVIEWGGYAAPTTVEWVFTAREDHTTFVSITNTGFQGTADEVVAQALDATEGFTLVLAGLKAYLEHGLLLNLVPDRFPDHHVV
jgi:uncharacterized protein YndB with AHSA1/START domain